MEPRISEKPSYFPDSFDTDSIPPTLKEEAEYWTTGKNQELSEKAALALVEAEILMVRLYASDTLRSMGLDPKAPKQQSTKGHNTKVGYLSLRFNDLLEDYGSRLAVPDIRVLAKACLLHDIGKLQPAVNKVAMSDNVYAADASERKIIELHPEIGAEVVWAMDGFRSMDEKMSVAEAVYQHHERYDGSGYHKTPRDEICPEAIIMGLADEVDAMGEDRTYRKALPADIIIANIERYKDKFHAELLIIAKKIRSMSGKFIRNKTPRPEKL